MTFNLDDVEILDTRAKRVDRKTVLKRLRTETVALASMWGQKVDPLHLRVIKDGTLIFVLPAPPGVPGAAPPGPGIPGPQPPQAVPGVRPGGVGEAPSGVGVAPPGKVAPGVGGAPPPPDRNPDPR
jgi:hypothetical protein